jgi:hypothetical protein
MPASAQRGEASSGSEVIRVLLVDPKLSSRTTTQQLLQECGYVVRGRLGSGGVRGCLRWQ